MLKHYSGFVVTITAIAISLSACSSSPTSASSASEGISPSASASASASTKDGTKAFVEAARDRVPMINSSSDAEIAKLGEDICVDPEKLGMTAAKADELHKSMLVLRDHAKNDAEASVILGLAKQHICRPS